jgi:thymidylate kinase
MAAQHISIDTEQTLQGIMPVIQQMMQVAQQFQPQPQLTPDAKVLLDTSMAETQRRAARDQAEMQLKDREMAADIERETLRLQADYELAMEEQKYKYAIAVGDMDMKERIESARLTRDAARLTLDRDKTAIELTKGV